jgi:hypothetical protein
MRTSGKGRSIPQALEKGGGYHFYASFAGALFNSAHFFNLLLPRMGEITFEGWRNVDRTARQAPGSKKQVLRSA